jgi:hypothetical protein
MYTVVLYSSVPQNMVFVFARYRNRSCFGYVSACFVTLYSFVSVYSSIQNNYKIVAYLNRSKPKLYKFFSVNMHNARTYYMYTCTWYTHTCKYARTVFWIRTWRTWESGAENGFFWAILVRQKIITRIKDIMGIID